MRKIVKPAPPDGFPDAVARQECEDLENLFGGGANQDARFAFKAYKSILIRSTLNDTFRFKCAYCESSFGATAPVQIEHFRPKAAYDVVDPETGKTVPHRPGYWWLASEWDNMLPSCIFCNSPNKQRFPDGTVRTSGKANRFPLADEATRATGPNEERKEKRLLLHPYRDSPRSHLEFDDEGLVWARNGSRKGRVSIDVYGLLRVGLVQERQKVVTFLRPAMGRVEDAAAANTEDPGSAAVLAARLAELEALAAPHMPYAEMAHQIIDRFKQRLLGGTPR
jgi:hypothetical protein